MNPTRVPHGPASFELSLGAAWFESIPSIVMLGETYYHKGHLQDALDQFESGLILAEKSVGWLGALEALPSVAKPESNKAEVGRAMAWGSSQRKTTIGHMHTRWQFTVLANGVRFHSPVGDRAAVGTIANVDAIEVIRTVAIALHRRWQILGPLATGNKRSQELEQAFAGEGTRMDATLAVGWKLCQAMSMLPEHPREEVDRLLQNATSLPGGIDTPFTPLALQLLGELAAANHEWPKAMQFFHEACLVAAHFEQHDVIAECVQHWSMIAASQRSIEAVAGLQQVAAWSKSRSLFVLASATSGIASIQASNQEWPAALQSVRQLKVVLSPRDVILPRLESFGFWNGARIAFGTEKPKEGLEQLERALEYAKGSEEHIACRKWLQSQRLLKSFQEGKSSIQQARQGMNGVLADLSEADWILTPTESMAWLMSDRTQSMELLIQSELLVGNSLQLVRAVDLLKRFQFTSRDPLGGRLLATKQLFCFEPTQSIPPNAMTS